MAVSTPVKPALDERMRLRDRLYRAVRERGLRQKLLDMRSWLSTHDLRVREIERGRALLVIAPHPDDEAIGCGGVIALAKRGGGRVDVVCCADGSRGFARSARPTPADREALAGRRRQEAEQAARVLGVDTLTFLAGEDQRLHLETGLRADLERALRARRYDLVLGPWPHDQHADHQAVWRALRRALRATGSDAEVWLYEVWAPLVPNLAVDISEVADEKRRAIAAYTSQLTEIDYADTALGLSRYRSVLAPGARYVEAFLGGDGRFVQRLPG